MQIFETILSLMQVVGIGGLLIMLIKVKTLLPAGAKIRVSEWLREQRLRAFGLLTKQLLADINHLSSDQLKSDSKSAASEALLLIGCDQLFERVYSFIEDRYILQKSIEDDGGNLTPDTYRLKGDVLMEAKQIIVLLRNQVVSQS